jgi:hypothetical protein
MIGQFAGVLRGTKVQTQQGLLPLVEASRYAIQIWNNRSSYFHEHPAVDWFWADRMVRVTLDNQQELMLGSHQYLLQNGKPLVASKSEGMFVDTAHGSDPVRVVLVEHLPVTGRVFRIRIQKNAHFSCGGVLLPAE